MEYVVFNKLQKNNMAMFGTTTQMEYVSEYA